MLDIVRFLKDGWCIVDVPYIVPPIVLPPDLEKLDESDFKKLHICVSEQFWEKEYSLRLAQSLLPTIHKLIGLDIMVQYNPYVRLARPNKPQDNIGYHKDTQYGQTPYELAVHIPFVDLDEKSAIRVISGSHLMPESAFQKVTGDGPLVQKGSIENRIGKPYAPKRLLVPDGMETTPLSMKVGQAAIFTPAIFHGQEVNDGSTTRVSCDLRFVNTLHADKVRVGKVHAGYVPVSMSPVEMLAAEYYQTQQVGMGE